MQIWDLRIDGIKQYAMLVHSEDGDDLGPIFTCDGKPKNWPSKPKVEPFIEKRKKTAKPRADISFLEPGTIILNKKAYQALKDFLLPFGQLLELDCQGEIEYFYNVTNLLPCIDYERSEKMGTAVVKEVFLAAAVPEEALVFKAPYTVRTYIYLNQAGKERFEQLATAAGLVGARFVVAGQGLA